MSITSLPLFFYLLENNSSHYFVYKFFKEFRAAFPVLCFNSVPWPSQISGPNSGLLLLTSAKFAIEFQLIQLRDYGELTWSVTLKSSSPLHGFQKTVFGYLRDAREAVLRVCLFSLVYSLLNKKNH